jgi:ribosomal protein L17
MKHKISKIKVSAGSDANQMLIKKLVRNFAQSGSIVTTITRAKILSATIQTLAHKALASTQSAKNVILPYFATAEAAQSFIDQVIARQTTKVASGCVRVLKLGARDGDAAPIAQVIWTNELPTKEIQK